MLAPEWSYKIDVEDIETTPTSLQIEADEEACKNLAQRLGIIGIKNLKADITLLQEDKSHIYYVFGSLGADVTQECVVTLEPVTDRVEDSFEAWFSQEDAVVSIARERRERIEKPGSIELEIMDERDDPEPVIEGQIDLGELVTQYLSLSLDAFPRNEKAEAEFPREGVRAGPEPVRPNPFAALKNIKFGKDKEKNDEK